MAIVNSFILFQKYREEHEDIVELQRKNTYSMVDYREVIVRQICKLPDYEFNDAAKEGDGERLSKVYKLAMLFYKKYGHFKYAYAVLLYLSQIKAILSESEADPLEGLDYRDLHKWMTDHLSLWASIYEERAK